MKRKTDNKKRSTLARVKKRMCREINDGVDEVEQALVKSLLRSFECRELELSLVGRRLRSTSFSKSFAVILKAR